MTAMNVYRLIVNGRVQGVFYRAHVQHMAQAHGFKGYVKNLPDGRVEAVVEANTDEQLATFKKILATGSPQSRVDTIIVEQLATPTLPHQGFTIEY